MHCVGFHRLWHSQSFIQRQKHSVRLWGSYLPIHLHSPLSLVQVYTFFFVSPNLFFFEPIFLLSTFLSLTSFYFFMPLFLSLFYVVYISFKVRMCHIHEDILAHTHIVLSSSRIIPFHSPVLQTILKSPELFKTKSRLC